MIFKPFKCTVITLIPKHAASHRIKDLRPIAVYKLISKILTSILGQILPSIISSCQAAFVPGQNIHNHILLAYEFLKGYGRKGGTPRTMIQMHLQKACDMVN